MGNKIKNIYFLLVLLGSAKSVYIFADKYFLLYVFIIGLVVNYKKLAHIPKELFVSISVWFGYFIINAVIIKSFHPYFMITYVMYLYIAWLIVSEYNLGLFEKYVQYVYYLSLISLVFYCWELFSYDTLNRFITFLDINQGTGYNYKSIVLFTIPNEADIYRAHTRNCGFAWEPGPFSSFVAIALFYNINSSKFYVDNYKRSIVFVLTILTTQSSTGYLMMIIIIIGYYVFKTKNVLKRYIVGGVIMIASVYAYQTIPFLQEKIENESQQDISEIMRSSEMNKQNLKPGRFASFNLALIDFKNYPIAGIGGYKDLRSGQQEGLEVNIINGLGRILSVYGVLGSAIFLYLIKKSGCWLSSYYQYSNRYIYPILLLIMGFGFGIIESPMICTLWLFVLFIRMPNKSINESIAYNSK